MMLYNDSVRKGNDQFYGFLKDLLDRLKNDLDFEYVLHVVSDSLYGVIQKDGSWNGMIGELIDKVNILYTEEAIVACIFFQGCV